MALPEWLKEEIDRRSASPRGWDSVDTASDGDASQQGPGDGQLPPAAKPWTKATRWAK